MRAWYPTLALCAVSSFAVLATCPTPARAQAPGGSAAAPAAPATPSPDAVEKAQNLFKKGSALYAQKKYAAALEEFRASYATVASPNSRLYIARCLADLGEHVDAYLEFQGVADEAAERAKTEERFAKTQETAQIERDEVAKKLALVSVTITHPESAAGLRVGGKDVPKDQWGKPYPAKPGQVDVVVTSTAGAPVTQTLTLAAGDRNDVTLDAAPAPAAASVQLTPEAPSSRAGLRPYAYIAGGVGVAGLALFTVAGIMSNSTYSDLSDTCNGPCPPERQDDIDKGKTQQTLANVGLVVGAVGIAAGATLFVLSLTGDDTSAEQQGGAPPRVAIGVAPGYATLRGTF